MKNDFSAIALSTAVASAALLLLTTSGAWAGDAGGHARASAGYPMVAATSAAPCMRPAHPYHRHGPSFYHGGPRSAMLAPGPRYAHPRAMRHPMFGRPLHGMPPRAKHGPEMMMRSPGKPAPVEDAAPTRSRSSATGTAESTAQGASVKIAGMRFAPAEVRVSVGDTVTWAHRDRAPHTVIGRGGAELQSQTLQPGRTFSHRFDEPGTYDYYCALHPSMSGTVIVE